MAIFNSSGHTMQNIKLIFLYALVTHKGWTIRFLRGRLGKYQKKNLSRTLTKEKNILHKKTTGGKIVQKCQGFRTIGDILYVFHMKIVGFYIKSEMN
jgi:hypothetical protein